MMGWFFKFFSELALHISPKLVLVPKSYPGRRHEKSSRNPQIEPNMSEQKHENKKGGGEHKGASHGLGKGDPFDDGATASTGAAALSALRHWGLRLEKRKGVFR